MHPIFSTGDEGTRRPGRGPPQGQSALAGATPGQRRRVNALLRQLRGKPLAEPVTALWFALLLILTVTEPLDEPSEPDVSDFQIAGS